MTESELEAWMDDQREKRRLKVAKQNAEATIAKGNRRMLREPQFVLELLDRLGA